MLVGLGEPDDAAVWRLDDHQALVVTVDFFTPVVDTPYEYGAIAAANALSDLYAMGARPIFALNIAAMPADLDRGIITEIMRGGAEKVLEAGAVIAGGHSVQDEEPKYGLVAIGLAQPDQLMTKTQAQSGDLLVLSKPLGTGVTTTALKNGASSQKDVNQAIEWMSRLNRVAAELALEIEVKAATDITGFGLLGHMLELSEASRVGMELWLPAIPFLRGAQSYAHQGHFPGGSADNKLFFGPKVTFDTSIDEYQQMLLFDAQTSGGLLLSVPADRLAELIEQAGMADQPLWVIGEVKPGTGVSVKSDSPEQYPGTGKSIQDLIFID